MLPILSRVELSIKLLIEHHNYLILIKREVAHAIDAALFWFRRYDAVIPDNLIYVVAKG